MTQTLQEPATRYEEATRAYFVALHQLTDERLPEAVRRQALDKARAVWFAAYAVLEKARNNERRSPMLVVPRLQR